MKTLEVSTKVKARAEINYRPYATIPPASRGIVVSNDDDGLEVCWDEYHPGLSRWQNCTLLVSPEADAIERDLENALVTQGIIAPRYVPGEHHWRNVGTTTAALFMLMGAAAVEALEALWAFTLPLATIWDLF